MCCSLQGPGPASRSTTQDSKSPPDQATQHAPCPLPPVISILDARFGNGSGCWRLESGDRPAFPFRFVQPHPLPHVILSSVKILIESLVFATACTTYTYPVHGLLVQRGARRVSVAKVFAASSEGWCVLVPVFLFLFLCFKVDAFRRMSASVGFHLVANISNIKL